MRRASMVGLAALALVLLLALPAHAQSIYGLTFRPTGAAPEDAPRGSVDIVAKGQDYLVSVDLSKATEALDIADFEGAQDFVVWVVDMDGKSANIGTLDADLKLGEVPISYFIAKLYVTAEAQADVQLPTGDRLYEVILRRVTEVTSSQSESGSAARSAADEATSPATAEATVKVAPTKAPESAAPKPTSAAPAATAVSAPAAKAQEAKPTVLPTTGSDLGDLLVLLAVAAALILTGLRLRTIRL